MWTQSLLRTHPRHKCHNKLPPNCVLDESDSVKNKRLTHNCKQSLVNLIPCRPCSISQARFCLNDLVRQIKGLWRYTADTFQHIQNHYMSLSFTGRKSFQDLEIPTTALEDRCGAALSLLKRCDFSFWPEDSNLRDMQIWEAGYERHTITRRCCLRCTLYTQHYYHIAWPPVPAVHIRST